MLSTDKQTNRQTDKLTNATKNITSFAKEVTTNKCSVTADSMANWKMSFIPLHHTHTHTQKLDINNTFCLSTKTPKAAMQFHIK